MAPTTYLDGIRAAYQGELIGESLYRELARRRADPGERAKLDAVADVERLTHTRLKPVAERLGIHPVEADWRPIVDRRANELASLAWPDFVDKALCDWPPYIERFEALKPLAPVGDATPIQQLVDHEVALVEFVRLEHAALERARLKPAVLKGDVLERTAPKPAAVKGDVLERTAPTPAALTRDAVERTAPTPAALYPVGRESDASLRALQAFLGRS